MIYLGGGLFVNLTFTLVRDFLFGVMVCVVGVWVCFLFVLEDLVFVFCWIIECCFLGWMLLVSLGGLD